jgi:hypothetical protein
MSKLMDLIFFIENSPERDIPKGILINEIENIKKNSKNKLLKAGKKLKFIFFIILVYIFFTFLNFLFFIFSKNETLLMNLYLIDILFPLCISIGILYKSYFSFILLFVYFLFSAYFHFDIYGFSVLKLLSLIILSYISIYGFLVCLEYSKYKDYLKLFPSYR